MQFRHRDGTIAIAAAIALLLGISRPTRAEAPPISSCRAMLIVQKGRNDPMNTIPVRDGAGEAFAVLYDGVSGDRIIAIRGGVDGLAIADDRYGRDWVNVEFVDGGLRGWVRRDSLSSFECQS
ncbi:hypothetical protein [Roseofilum casamattae]|uniref:SH3 domain-containing protein n=1 Tax=Roseofilum casamattae BLCC-M143 TaxID=3022442 RepID=A0ABT7BWK0_9CYAN|nr:hypothetical protein [Roseofilum casamattae]MDJ1183187.1 hypothetical protein [Roseofilum casamattae BLCC-M143]